jgi:hypothetical protein
MVTTTIPKFQKGWSDLTIRHRVFLAALAKKGRIEYNASGLENVWQIEFSQPEVTVFNDSGQTLQFSNHDAFRQVSTGWGHYIATDSMGKLQDMANKGDEALVSLFQTKMNRLAKSIKDNIHLECYGDGEAPGRAGHLHGLETFLGVGTVTAGDLVAIPDDTYGKTLLPTKPGSLGGRWSASGTTFPNATLAKDWPNGSGEAAFDAASPKLVNWSSNAWGTNSTLWEDNCWRSISQTITWLYILGGSDGLPGVCVMSSDLYQGFKNHHEVLRRLMVPHNMSDDIGYEGLAFNMEGVALTTEYGIPAQTAYMMNMDHIVMRSLHDDLIWVEGPDKVPERGWAWVMAAGFFGNLCFQPKYVAKLYPYA